MICWVCQKERFSVNKREDGYLWCNECWYESVAPTPKLKPIPKPKDDMDSLKLFLGDSWSAFNKLYDEYWQNARRKGLFFTICRVDFWKITKERCYYCGDLPSKVRQCRQSEYYFNGLDRVDNDVGYTIDNIVPCCTRCNLTKGSMSRGIFLSLVDKIHAFQHGA